MIDLFSRKVVGCSMSSRIKAQRVCDALKMATWRRRPEKGLIRHFDRGFQYVSRQFRTQLNTHDLKGSMNRKGDCWDNAAVESFFGSLKQVEKLLNSLYGTTEQPGIHDGVVQQWSVALVFGLYVSQ